MASVVMMKDPKTGVIKKGFYGFSWTTFFWGGFPALFRGDFLIGLVLFVLQLVTMGLSGIICAFFYNKMYTTRLLKEGFEFADSEAVNTLARAKLGVVPA